MANWWLNSRGNPIHVKLKHGSRVPQSGAPPTTLSDMAHDIHMMNDATAHEAYQIIIRVCLSFLLMSQGLKQKGCGVLPCSSHAITACYNMQESASKLYLVGSQFEITIVRRRFVFQTLPWGPAFIGLFQDELLIYDYVLVDDVDISEDCEWCIRYNLFDDVIVWFWGPLSTSLISIVRQNLVIVTTPRTIPLT